MSRLFLGWLGRLLRDRLLLGGLAGLFLNRLSWLSRLLLNWLA